MSIRSSAFALSIRRLVGCACALGLLAIGAWGGAAWAAAGERGDGDGGPLHLRVVGGLGQANQFLRIEQPFWTRDLPRLTQGQVTAEIVPFDRAGMRGAELLRMVQLGAVSFGTVLLHTSDEPDLFAADLAGQNADMPALRRSVTAFRPYLASRLRERFGAELLAVYTYSAQVVFCTRPIASLADLRGRRVRTSSTSQADLVAGVGGMPVQTPFAEIAAHIAGGNLDCVITGAMSANMIGLHEVTNYLFDLPITWGVAAFVANGAAWRALPERTRGLLSRELARLEQTVWRESEREGIVGVACDTGADGCRDGRPGRMQRVEPSAAALAQRHRLYEEVVRPRWLQRCGSDCAVAWQNVGESAAGGRR